MYWRIYRSLRRTMTGSKIYSMHAHRSALITTVLALIALGALA